MSKIVGCHRCPHRPNAGRRYIHTKCATCNVYQKLRQPETATYGDLKNIEEPSRNTWRKLDMENEEPTEMGFKYWLLVWIDLPTSMRDTISIIILNQGLTQAEIARKLGVSREAIRKRVSRLKERFPGVFLI